MEDNDIFDILNDWNCWHHDIPSGIERTAYLDRFSRLLDSGQVVTVTGPRRAGKSYIMRQMMTRLAGSGVPKNNLLFVNFEDPRFIGPDAALMDHLFRVYKNRLEPQGTPYVFLDEVQEAAGWEKWVLAMHELKKAVLVVSGSNAHLLSRELGTLLTGRHLDLTVYPLSFNEYLYFVRHTPAASGDDMRELLRRYLEHGGFPEVFFSDRKQELLLAYFGDLLTKDLLRRHRVRKQELFKSHMMFLLSNAGNLITHSSSARSLQTTADTVEKFTGYAESAYLAFCLKRFSYKVREQDKSPRKVYAVDTGLCSAVGFRFSANTGRLAENLVFLALRRSLAAHPGRELYYWKDEHHREVDFVVKDGPEITGLVQVCWNMEDEKTRKRELRSLRKAMGELKVPGAVVVTGGEDRSEEADAGRVRMIPLYRWLIENG